MNQTTFSLSSLLLGETIKHILFRFSFILICILAIWSVIIFVSIAYNRYCEEKRIRNYIPQYHNQTKSFTDQFSHRYRYDSSSIMVAVEKGFAFDRVRSQIQCDRMTRSTTPFDNDSNNSTRTSSNSAKVQAVIEAMSRPSIEKRERDDLCKKDSLSMYCTNEFYRNPHPSAQYGFSPTGNQEFPSESQITTVSKSE